MISTRNKIIKELYLHLGVPVIPNMSTQNRPPYPYADYSITTVVAEDGEGNQYMDSVLDIEHLDTQSRLSFSFNAYSKNEVESYTLAEKIFQFFKFKGVDLISVSVIDVLSVNNRSLLEVDEFEFRYGLDVLVRFDDNISREVNIIENYNINKE